LHECAIVAPLSGSETGDTGEAGARYKNDKGATPLDVTPSGSPTWARTTAD